MSKDIKWILNIKPKIQNETLTMITVIDAKSKVIPRAFKSHHILMIIMISIQYINSQYAASM